MSIPPRPVSDLPPGGPAPDPQAQSPAAPAQAGNGMDSTNLDPNQPVPRPRPSQGRISLRPPTDPGATNGTTSPTNGSEPTEAKSATPAEPRTLGEFRILRRLGEGGMGAVYLGYHEQAKRQVAIKVLSDHLGTNRDCVDRFYREARIGALLDHPNIVRGITAGKDPATGRHYLVQEFVDGPSARGLLDKLGRLPVGDAVHFILEIAQALEYLHARSFVHRDIKPDNVLITPSGVAKLADLGLAKRLDDATHLTAMHQGFGTPYYMPYEQSLNARFADGRSDLFALGATLYHLITGEVPFPGDNAQEIHAKKMAGSFRQASEIVPQIPFELDRILGRMLANNPRERYQTASELIVDLERSRLAVALPSFINLDQALLDPLMRARLTSPAAPTQMDANPRVSKVVVGRDTADLWYLRHRNAKGKWSKVKATTAQIEQRIADGRLGQRVRVGRQPQGPFRPLSSYPEFAKAFSTVVNSARNEDRALPRKGRRGRGATALRSWFRRWGMMLCIGLALGAIVGLFALLYRLVLTS